MVKSKIPIVLGATIWVIFQNSVTYKEPSGQTCIGIKAISLREVLHNNMGTSDLHAWNICPKSKGAPLSYRDLLIIIIITYADTPYSSNAEKPTTVF